MGHLWLDAVWQENKQIIECNKSEKQPATKADCNCSKGDPRCRIRHTDGFLEHNLHRGKDYDLFIDVFIYLPLIKYQGTALHKIMQNNAKYDWLI